jgi:membrane protein
VQGNISMPTFKRVWSVTRCATLWWVNDQAATTGAALAFYCAFSLAPLLVILVTLAGWVVGSDLAYHHLTAQLNSLFGASTSEVLMKAVRTSQDSKGTLATVVSIVSLIIGATTVFAALETALEQIWRAGKLTPSGVKGWIRGRLLSFGLILAVGFLLLVSLTFTTALSAMGAALSARVTGWVIVAGLMDFIISTALSAVLIAFIYRYMPARRLPWRPVLQGALITAVLFHLGRWGIGLYLGNTTQPSAFGAAASFVALLLWLYYSAQIFLLGAEFTACMGGLKEDREEKKAIPGEPLRQARAS